MLARLRHFGEAAKQCFVSQPTLSMQIKKLEETLGVSLFERSNKQVMLTEQGQSLLGHAQAVLDEAAKMKEAARAVADPLAGELRLGAIPTLAPYLFPLIMPVIQQHFPRLRVWLLEERTSQLIEKLGNGAIDAAIMALPVTSDFHSELLFTEPFYLACVPDNPLAKLKAIPLRKLAGQSILLLEEGHCLRDQAMDVCRLAKADTQADFTATSLETLRLMVAAGLGVTLLPALARQGVDAPQLSLIPFEAPQPQRQVALFWRPNSAKLICLQKLAKLIISTVKPALA